MPMKKLRSLLLDLWYIIQIVCIGFVLWLFGDYQAHREDYE